MGSCEGSTMWTRIRDTLRDVCRFTCKPIITHSLCSTSLLANVSPYSVVQPLNEVECYSADISSYWNKKCISNADVTGDGTGKNEMIDASGKKGSRWLVKLIGKEVGFNMSTLSSVVYGGQSVDEDIHQKQPISVSFVKHPDPHSVADTIASNVESDSCTSAGFTLKKRLLQGLVQCCHSWPISLAKTLQCSDWPMQLSDHCTFKQANLSSSISNKMLLYCGVQCNSSTMDKYQDLYHQNSWGLCTNNSNIGVGGTSASADEVSIDRTGKMNHTSAMSSGNHIPAMLDRKHDGTNCAVGAFVEDNSNCSLLPHSPVKLGCSRPNKMVDANLSALTRPCSSCEVANSQRITTSTPCVVQDLSSDENKGKKHKKTRPSAKKRRRLKQKREPDNQAPSGIGSRSRTAEHQISDKIGKDNLHVTMTDHHVDHTMEDNLVVISGISFNCRNDFVMSPDVSSDSDSDDMDGGFVDMDDADALWDSFTNGIQLDSMSFQFTCTISASPSALFSDVDFGTSSRVHDANKKWNESYQETGVVSSTAEDIQNRKVCT